MSEDYSKCRRILLIPIRRTLLSAILLLLASPTLVVITEILYEKH